MKKYFFPAAAAVLLLAGCATERLPSEDIEVPVVCADIIKVLKDPSIGPNSRQKYEAAKALVKKVDLTFTRETSTLNEIFYHKDALIDFPDLPDRTITFNYQYRDNYIRFQFRTFRNFVTRVDITEK
ncbi:MAG: hypothetical protein IJS01_08650 [Lentisphaeria bacterium]|nr:hypothetical protein [Lentisphaeria bacterium]